jgi:hypothetical protein
LKLTRLLYAEGGILRFYKGYAPRLASVALNGALFNSLFVFFKKAFEEGPGS